MSLEGNKVWAIHRAGADFDTVSLLHTEASALWNAIRPVPGTRKDVIIDIPLSVPPPAVYLASPGPQPDAVSVPFVYAPGRLQFTVPSLNYWTLAVIPHPPQA